MYYGNQEDYSYLVNCLYLHLYPDLELLKYCCFIMLLMVYYTITSTIHLSTKFPLCYNTPTSTLLLSNTLPLFYYILIIYYYTPTSTRLLSNIFSLLYIFFCNLLYSHLHLVLE